MDQGRERPTGRSDTGGAYVIGTHSQSCVGRNTAIALRRGVSGDGVRARSNSCVNRGIIVRAIHRFGNQSGYSSESHPPGSVWFETVYRADCYHPILFNG